MRAEAIDVSAATLLETLRAAAHPVPPFIDAPRLVLHDHFVAVLGVGGQAGDPAEVRGLGETGGRECAGGVVDIDARGSEGIGAGADALASRRMEVAEVAVVNELPLFVAARLEVEGAPRD